MLVRCSLPVRDICLSPDGEWAAVACDELEVKVVNTRDMTRVIYLREQSRPVKHVSYDTTGISLAASCTDGIIYIYSLTSEQPQLVKRVDGVIKTLETDAEASSKALWHPDNRVFASPTAARGIRNPAIMLDKANEACRYPMRGSQRLATAESVYWSPGRHFSSRLDLEWSFTGHCRRRQVALLVGDSYSEAVEDFR
jgi:hypothetical protein